MMYRKRANVLSMIVLACLVLPACTSQAPQMAEPATAAPQEQPAAAAAAYEEVVALNKWDVPYEKAPPELCPPDIECEPLLKFDAPTPELYNGQEVWVQHGLHANEQGELFRMNVTGASTDTGKLYTDNVKVCFDRIFIDGTVAVEPSETDFHQPLEKFGVNLGDLIIDVSSLGQIDLGKTSREDVISQLFTFSAQEWASQFKEMGFELEHPTPGEFKQGYVVDLVIDPEVMGRSTHYYPHQAATAASTDVSVGGEGGGSVTGELYCNAIAADTTTVSRESYPDPESDTLSHDNQGAGADYYLAITGNDNGTYRLSGRFAHVARWKTEFAEESPCAPGALCLSPGKSATQTITHTTDPQPVPKLDVLLLFDVSSSMATAIEAVRQNASYIMETLTLQGIDAAFGIASFSDYPEVYGTTTDYPWNLDQYITSDTGSVQWVLNALGLRDGGDFPECYSRALFEAMRISWRPDAKKVIVLFGDSVPHDTEFFQAEFGENTGVDPGPDAIAKTEDDLIFTKVVDGLKGQAEVIPINCTSNDGRVIAAYEYLAKETNGQVFNLDDAAKAPEAVMRGLEAATAQINQLTILPGPNYASWVKVEPESHYGVGGGESRSFEITITVPEEIEPGLYQVDLTVLGDGAVRGVHQVMLDVKR